MRATVDTIGWLTGQPAPHPSQEGHLYMRAFLRFYVPRRHEAAQPPVGVPLGWRPLHRRTGAWLPRAEPCPPEGFVPMHERRFNERRATSSHGGLEASEDLNTL